MGAKKGKIADSAPIKSLSADQWLKEVLEVRPAKDGPGRTTLERAAALGVSEPQALKLLKRADAMGKLRHAAKVITRFDGRPMTTRCYEVLPEGK